MLQQWPKNNSKKKPVNVNADQGDTKGQMKKQRKTDRGGQKCFRKRRKRRRNLVNRTKIKIQQREDDSEQWKRRKTEEDKKIVNIKIGRAHV